MRSRILAVAAALVLAAAGPRLDPGDHWSIAGRVTDAQGLAVPGATVTVTGPQGAQTFTSDAEAASTRRS